MVERDGKSPICPQRSPVLRHGAGKRRWQTFRLPWRLTFIVIPGPRRWRLFGQHGAYPVLGGR